MNELTHFKKEGFIKFQNLLSKTDCAKIINLLKKNRKWGEELFLTEKKYLKQTNLKKTNPGKNIQNLANKYDLDFVEKNKKIKNILTKILGENYDVIISKFIVSVPEKWMPKYVRNLDKKDPLKNLNKFIKRKYRDVTYFKGLDFHMDSIDRKFQNNQFITMYVYLDKVDSKMSPIELVGGSHRLGHTLSPHYIRNIKKNSLEYSLNGNSYYKFKKKKLIGGVGDVFIWTSHTLHGTYAPKKKNKQFRISLRYLIEKKTKKKSFLEKVIKPKIISRILR